jgi:integrase/recombinase XerC
MSRADILETWGSHLTQGRRRSPHTVRAYVSTAARFLDVHQDADWPQLACLDSLALRNQLARRRADGIGNVSAARELSAKDQERPATPGDPR